MRGIEENEIEQDKLICQKPYEFKKFEFQSIESNRATIEDLEKQSSTGQAAIEQESNLQSVLA